MIRAILTLALLCPLSAYADPYACQGSSRYQAQRGGKEECPSDWFCMKAKAHRALFSSDKAAEDAAIALGASQATIAKAKRCRR